MNAIAFTTAALTRAPAYRELATRAGAGLVCQLWEDSSISRAAVMRSYLSRGPATQGQLARSARLASAALVPVLLHHDLKTGRVVRTLVLTGERAQESAARAKYAQFERHRADTRESKKVPRHVDVWRAVHSWSAQQVWALIAKWRVVPHAAYHFVSRCSCMLCVFAGKDQWATVRVIAREKFQRVAQYEKEFGVTIHRKMSVVEQADAGIPYVVDPKWVAIANSDTFDHPVFVDEWVLPAGAYGDSCGPT